MISRLVLVTNVMKRRSFVTNLKPPLDKETAFKIKGKANTTGKSSSENLLTEDYQHDVIDSIEANLTPFPDLTYTEHLKIYPCLKKPFPAFRILLPEGAVVTHFSKTPTPLMNSHEKMKKIYQSMLTLQTMDEILYNSQRQGRISFYMTSSGEEGCVVASAAGLEDQDIVYGQYRESGVLLYRGYELGKIMNQVFSNELDDAGGRQMPVHFGSRELNYMTISSPLATQIPQATGAAYALKRTNQGKKKEEKQIVACYFGDGAASEGDFHAGLNFAATLECPILFFWNNGYAISTPISEQYRGDGIASRGGGYGITTYRVDGNDVLAVHEAVRVARNAILETDKPVLIEAMTYRLGHHSTSDDSSAYRSSKEVESWATLHGPFHRFRQYIEKQGIMKPGETETIISSVKTNLLKEFQRAERQKKPDPLLMFDKVYAEELPHIKRQKEELQRLLLEYPELE